MDVIFVEPIVQNVKANEMGSIEQKLDINNITTFKIDSIFRGFKLDATDPLALLILFMQYYHYYNIDKLLKMEFIDRETAKKYDPVKWAKNVNDYAPDTKSMDNMTPRKLLFVYASV